MGKSKKGLRKNYASLIEKKNQLMNELTLLSFSRNNDAEKEKKLSKVIEELTEIDSQLEFPVFYNPI